MRANCKEMLWKEHGSEGHFWKNFAFLMKGKSITTTFPCPGCGLGHRKPASKDCEVERAFGDTAELLSGPGLLTPDIQFCEKLNPFV